MQTATVAARRASRASIARLESAIQGMQDAARIGKSGIDGADCEVRLHVLDVAFHEPLRAPVATA